MCTLHTHKTAVSSYQRDVMEQGFCEWNVSSKTLYSNTQTHTWCHSAAVSSPLRSYRVVRYLLDHLRSYDAGHKKKVVIEILLPEVQTNWNLQNMKRWPNSSFLLTFCAATDSTEKWVHLLKNYWLFYLFNQDKCKNCNWKDVQCRVFSTLQQQFDVQLSRFHFDPEGSSKGV